MTWGRRAGDRIGAEARFFAKVSEVPDGCWNWTGARNAKGYGYFRSDGGGPLVSAHRWAWQLFRGDIPDGLEIDHLCLNRGCVNPDHLDVVTRAVNVARGRTNQNDGITHCKRGHAFDEANTSIDRLGKRCCKTCAREKTRRFRENRKAA